MSDVTTLTGSPAPSAPAEPNSAPNTATEARDRRDAILADKSIGEKYRRGDTATVNEIRELNRIIAEEKPGSRLDAVLSGTAQPGLIEQTTEDDALTTSQIAGEVDRLRVAGLTDEAIRDVINGTPISAAQHRAFENFKKRCLADHDWVRRYRQRDAEAVRDFTWFSAGVIAPIAE